MLNFDPLLFDGDDALARASLDRIWNRLIADGTALMPLGEYPFSERYGWVQDRYGVSWQLMLTDPAGDPRPFVLPAMLFGERVQNHAGEAVGHYLDAFADIDGGAELGAYVLYPEKVGPAEPGTVQFSDFRLGDQWFVAMDSAAEQAFSFTCGVSLEVRCEDQDEIDRYWDALSAVPEAEQCGWLADRFGVSWQIVPANMGELMERPDAFEKMLEMKKLVIADF
jgi:predicted 3-demethylubiquinone-9 3-methyltransferase (glyoxalase superfamily)